MEKRVRRPVLLEKTARILDLPADIIANLPKVELTGDSELRMENHRGILSCGREEIHISGGVFLVKVSGEELEVRAMTGLEVLITGVIRSVELT